MRRSSEELPMKETPDEKDPLHWVDQIESDKVCNYLKLY